VSIYIGIISLILLSNIYKFGKDLKKFKKIRRFYNDVLKVKDSDLISTDWKYIVDRLLKNQLYFSTKNNLTAEKLLALIMRKENYLIGLVESGILPLKWGENHLLTKMSEWIIYTNIINTVCDSDGDNPTTKIFSIEFTLKKRFKTTGILFIVLSPFLLIFMLIYIILIYGNKYHSQQKDSYRQWAPYSLCRFREYNELPHLFEERISKSIKYAHYYIRSFNINDASWRIMKLMSFMVSALLVTLLTLGFLNEDMMGLHIGNHALGWYTVVFGVILTILKLLDTEPYISKSKEEVMERIKRHTRFLPNDWDKNPSSHKTYKDYVRWFQPTTILYVQELISVILIPVVLMKMDKSSIKKISEYLIQNTIIDNDYGVFIKMSTLENNMNDEKMERSIIGFKSYYDKK